MAIHHFGSGKFKRELWIADKRVFKRPQGVMVEFVTGGAFDWVFADESGKEVLTRRHENLAGGWTGVDFFSLGLHGDHSIGFRNVGSNELEIKQGDVTFKD